MAPLNPRAVVVLKPLERPSRPGQAEDKLGRAHLVRVRDRVRDRVGVGVGVGVGVRVGATVS